MAHGGLSQFKATLARNKERKEKAQGKFDRKKLGFKNPDSKPEYDFTKLSDSELEKLKKEIQEKIKSERQNELIIFGMIFIGLICLLFYLAY